MSIVGRLWERRDANLKVPPTWLLDALRGRPTASGVDVNEESALRMMAVYGAVRNLSEDLSTLPLPVFRRLSPRGKERAPEHHLYPLLHDVANDEMNAMTCRQTMQNHLGLWGNAYAHSPRNNAGEVMELWPMNPKRVRQERNPQGEIVYVVELPKERSTTTLRRDEVFHIPGFSLNGLKGLSPIGLAREAVAIAQAQEEYWARFYPNDGSPGVVLTHPKSLDDPKFQRIKSTWEEAHTGLSRAHKVALLEDGMDIKSVAIPPADAQFLESRRFQVDEIARLYRMPPHKIAEMANATFTNIEHQSIEYVVDTIRPWTVRWEQAIAHQLMPKAQRATFFAEHVIDGLLRGDMKTRMESYRIGREIGVYCVDDLRELENKNPLPDGAGQVFLQPLNMTVADIDGLSKAQRVEAVGSLVRAGFDPKEALKLMGLDPIKHLGVPPVTLQSDLTPGKRAEQRSAASRKSVAKAFHQVFADGAARVVKRERADVMRAAEKHLTVRGMDDFSLWLDQFYSEHEHEEFVREQMTPAFSAFADAVVAEAADDVGGDPRMTPELEAFLTAYVIGFGTRWVISSRRQINQVANTALSERRDAVAALSERFDEWIERRPDKTGTRETVQAGNALAMEVYRANGTQRTTWAASGNACPLCQELDGRTVDIGEPYLTKGDPFQPDGVDTPLVPSGDRAHPPAHGGCDCSVVPA